MTKLREINRLRYSLGLGALPCAVTAAGVPGVDDAGDNYKEWEHPRDKNGQWIEKLSSIKFGNDQAGIIESVNRDGSITARVTHSSDEKQVGTRVLVDPKEVEAIDVKARLSEQSVQRIVVEGKRPWNPRRPIFMGNLDGFDTSSWSALKASLMKRDMIIFDTETTGFDVGPNGTDGPIEIGAVRMRGGKVVDRFQTFIKPKESIPPLITEITSIDDDMVKDAPDEKTGVANFLAWANLTGDEVLVGHNVGFDINALGGGNVIPDDQPSLDTVALARGLMPEGNSPVPNHKLGTLADYFGVPLDAHRADNDSEATATILGHMLNWGEKHNRSTVSMENILEQHHAYNRELARYAEELAVYRKLQAEKNTEE